MTDRTTWMESWFDEGQSDGLILCPPDFIARLRVAFSCVFKRMRDEELVTFDEANVTLIAPWAANALVWPPLHVFGSRLRLLFLMDTLGSLDEAELSDVIAHECAHIVCGHEGLGNSPDEASDTEREADALSVTWGFRARYDPSGSLPL